MRQFMDGEASVYALVAKDQLMSFRDLSFAACSARERAEVETSARSQREAAGVRAAAVAAGGKPLKLANEHDGPLKAVVAALSLADAQMDDQWSAVSASPVYGWGWIYDNVLLVLSASDAMRQWVGDLEVADLPLLKEGFLHVLFFEGLGWGEKTEVACVLRSSLAGLQAKDFVVFATLPMCLKCRCGFGWSEMPKIPALCGRHERCYIR